MNRRFNTVLFLIGATVLNLILLMFYFLMLTALAGLFLPVRVGWVAVVTWVLIFAGALTAGWFTYRWALGILKDRVPLDQWLDPHLFRGLF